MARRKASPPRTRPLYTIDSGQSGILAAMSRTYLTVLEQSVTSQNHTDGSSNKVPANLSYDTRIRDTPVETSIAAGIQAFKETIASLDEISRFVPEDKPVVLKADTGPYEQVLHSTFGREVCDWFLVV